MDVVQFLSYLGSQILFFMESFVPNYVVPNLRIIIRVVLLLLMAYIIGNIGKAVAMKILSVSGLKKVTVRSWTDDILKAVGYRGTIIGLIGDLVKWFIYIMFFGLIIETLGFPGLVNTFNQIAIFVPRFIVAILVVVIGFLVADFLGKIFDEAGRMFFSNDSLGILSGVFIKYSIALMSIIMALSLLGLDTISLTIFFSIILAGLIFVIVIGVRDLLPNYTSSLQIKRDIRIGDHIKISGYSGQVEKITGTSVTIKNGDKKIVIPAYIFSKEPMERIKNKVDINENNI